MISPSRPNTVLNHGMPAYGYGPLVVSLVIITMSDRLRPTQSLKSSLELVMWAERAIRPPSSRADRSSAVA